MRTSRGGSMWNQVVGVAMALCACAGYRAHAAGPLDLGPALAPIQSRTGMPAIAAAVFRDGTIVGRGIVGTRAIGDPAAARIEDPFLIGSCAKSMMRVLVARLVDRGLLRFETTLADALPDVPMREEYRPVTIAQVLAHRGGIPTYTMIGPKRTPWLFELTGSAVDQRRAFAEHVLQEAPAGGPGAEMIYSNAGYGLLAHIAETRAGRPWEQLVADEVFRPLGLATAKVGYPTSDTDTVGVHGHFYGEQGYERVPKPRTPLAPFSPAGMVSCSIEDFARLAGFLVTTEAGASTDVIRKESAQQIAGAIPGGGDEGATFYGGEGTFSAAFALWPSLGLAIVVQTNGGDADDVCTAAIEAVRALVAPDARQSPDLAAMGGGGGPGGDSGPRGGLGIRFRAVNEVLEVEGVAPGSPAESVGIKPEDRVEKINGKAVGDLMPQQAIEELRRDTVVLSVKRGDRSMEFTLHPAPPPAEVRPAGPSSKG